MKWSEALPVVISLAVIILVAVVEKQSRLIAAVTATMPLTMPLAVWIVYSSSKGEKIAMEQFTRGLIIGIIPTLGFAVAVWIAARAGMKLGAMLVAGYAAWGAVLLLMMTVRRFVGW